MILGEFHIDVYVCEVAYSYAIYAVFFTVYLFILYYPLFISTDSVHTF